MEVVCEASLAWYSKSKELLERRMSCNMWPGIIFCFLAGTASVLALVMKLSVDPYCALAQWGTWTGHPEHQQGRLIEGPNAISLGGKQSLEDIDVGDHDYTAQAGDIDDDAVNDKYFIQGTSIRGRKAVDRFQAHTVCLSASGRWVYDPRPRKLPWLAVKEYDWVKRCDKQHTRHRGPGANGVMGEMADSIALANGTAGTWSVREELKWVWRTNDSSCPWYVMDRDDFCRRIGSNRNVLVVGDSINHELSVAIQNALTMNVSSAVTQQHYPGEELCSDVLGGVGKGVAVHFVRNDYVSLRTNSTSVGRNFQDPWITHLDSGDGNIKILVLNRGAHYQDDRKFVQGLRATFSVLRDRHPDLLVLYRNTPPGHMNCSDFHAPLPVPLKGAPTPFHWEDFDRQNSIAKSMVEEFNFIYLDVSRALGMRPEGHMHSGDCLHYCQPGPLDLAVEMIYNVLLSL